MFCVKSSAVKSMKRLCKLKDNRLKSKCKLHHKLPASLWIKTGNSELVILCRTTEGKMTMGMMDSNTLPTPPHGNKCGCGGVSFACKVSPNPKMGVYQVGVRSSVELYPSLNYLCCCLRSASCRQLWIRRSWPPSVLSTKWSWMSRPPCCSLWLSFSYRTILLL